MSVIQIEDMPRNQENDPRYNRDPGVAFVEGSAYAEHMRQFEQFPSKFGISPGRPYAYRPYPKMLYKAFHFNGKACCMAAEPDSYEFKDSREYERAQEQARRFTEKCQRIVGNEEERSRAMEDGWRESAEDAVAYLEGRDRARSTATAERNYEDRNMSEAAKREIADVIEASGGEHQPEISGRKVSEARDEKRRKRG